MADRRKVAGVFEGDGFHWVGDGFHVTQLFPSPNDLTERLSPFLLMDYGAPHDYEPTTTPRGVGVHPHRGFETVTVAFEGALAHHDSSGGGGVIRAGDVQWMTAARGILHKEYHDAEWAETGGRMHMMQLWVNLPAANKMDDPKYQSLTADAMGVVDLAGDNGRVRIIAGEYQGVRGPAETFTQVDLWDATLNPGGSMELSFPATDNAALFVMDGTVEANGAIARQNSLVLFENQGEDIAVAAEAGARFLVLAGTPIDEPVVSYGPFVMNTRAEIVEAIDAFNAGEFGSLN
ncbi:MAG: pirin family protein [Acidimicrobiales bacterium]|nr:pirin family protein [Acidimicrobiales bacterium]